MRIVSATDDSEDNIATTPEMRLFQVQNLEGTAEETLVRNKLLERLEMDDRENDAWIFTAMTSHQGPLKPMTSNTKAQGGMSKHKISLTPLKSHDCLS
jgi:hypothetical protein